MEPWNGLADGDDVKSAAAQPASITSYVTGV